MSTAPAPKTKAAAHDYVVKDISLADWGRKEIAIAETEGPEAGLRLVEALAGEPALAGYHLLPAVRGDLLEKLGRRGDARAEFERAAAMTGNARERTLLLERAAACAAAPASPTASLRAAAPASPAASLRPSEK